MNTAAKGARNEHRSMAILEAAGYRCTRSAASLGEWDIIGVGQVDVVLCQVRTRDWPGPLEREALKEFIAPTFVRKLLHRWRPRKRLPDVMELLRGRRRREGAEIMSKASEWVKKRPRPISIYGERVGKHVEVRSVFVDDDTGGMRIENYGPFPRKESLRLAHWILDTFDAAPPPGPRAGS